MCREDEVLTEEEYEDFIGWYLRLYAIDDEAYEKIKKGMVLYDAMTQTKKHSLENVNMFFKSYLTKHDIEDSEDIFDRLISYKSYKELIKREYPSEGNIISTITMLLTNIERARKMIDLGMDPRYLVGLLHYQKFDEKKFDNLVSLGANPNDFWVSIISPNMWNLGSKPNYFDKFTSGVDYILANGADINYQEISQEGMGDTPLLYTIHCIKNKCYKDEWKRVIDYMMMKGADINLCCSISSFGGYDVNDEDEDVFDRLERHKFAVENDPWRGDEATKEIINNCDDMISYLKTFK